METKLDINDPYLQSSAGKQRKEELIYEFFNHDQKLKEHAFSCPIMRDGDYDIDCDICKKFLGMINILIQEEKRKEMGKLDVKSMVEKGIVEFMVFGDGIIFQDK